MKYIAWQRIEKELKKRKFIKATERQRRLLNFVAFTTTSNVNKLKVASSAFKLSAKGGVSRCRNHCFISGRAHSNYSAFRMTRNMVRELAHQGRIYGLRKSSW